MIASFSLAARDTSTIPPADKSVSITFLIMYFMLLSFYYNYYDFLFLLDAFLALRGGGHGRGRGAPGRLRDDRKLNDSQMKRHVSWPVFLSRCIH